MNADVPAGLLAFYGGGSQTGSIAAKQQVDQPSTTPPIKTVSSRHHQQLPTVRFEFHEGDSRLPRPIKQRW